MTTVVYRNPTTERLARVMAMLQAVSDSIGAAQENPDLLNVKIEETEGRLTLTVSTDTLTMVVSEQP